MPFTEEQIRSKLHGEDSTTQYKLKVDHAASLAENMIAFSNSRGGCIIVGVNDDGARNRYQTYFRRTPSNRFYK